MMKVPGQDAVEAYIKNSNSQKKRLTVVRLASEVIAQLSNWTAFQVHLSDKICVPSFTYTKGGASSEGQGSDVVLISFLKKNPNTQGSTAERFNPCSTLHA